MDVKTLCLGVLTLGEASGYDIKKYFECTFSHFYVAGFGSIYPALAELSQSGLVTCRMEPQRGRPDRKVYAITPAGRNAFAAALAEAYPTHRVRSEFLVLLYFAHLLPADRMAEIIDIRLAALAENIERCEQFLSAPETSSESPPGARFASGLGCAVMQAARHYLMQHRDAILSLGDTDDDSDLAGNS